MKLKPNKYADVIARYPELKSAYDKLLDLIIEHGMPKLGRWAYCKYCHKHVLPYFSFGDDLVQCTECGTGLAPLGEVIKVGSLRKWREKLELDFARMSRYLNEVRSGNREPDGMDEYGLVPYICSRCKAQEATVFSAQHNYCSECARAIR
jgi:hypothetical protein